VRDGRALRFVEAVERAGHPSVGYDRVGRAPESRFALDADWLGTCRRACAAVRDVLAAHPLTADRSPTTGRGEGGDLALVIDRRAEDAIFAEIERLGLPLCIVSEERGHVELEGGGDVHVVIDPIDGSLNAKRRVPLYSVSLAVAGGRSMEDVAFAYVYDLGRGEEWWAERGNGAYLDGERLPALDPEARLELLGIESANPRIVAANAELLAGTGAYRLRAIGSIALALCFVAGARFDGMLSLYDCRSVDSAAGQLLVRELGGCVAFPDAGADLAAVPLGLEMRSRVVAAASPALLERLLAALTEEMPERAARPPAPGG
jgi:myo-inositol-1(or 4)-monophosphatase